MTAEEKLKEHQEGKTYYVDYANGDNRNDGRDHGGWIMSKDNNLIRNIHFIRTISKAFSKCCSK